MNGGRFAAAHDCFDSAISIPRRPVASEASTGRSRQTNDPTADGPYKAIGANSTRRSALFDRQYPGISGRVGRCGRAGRILWLARFLTRSAPEIPGDQAPNIWRSSPDPGDQVSSSLPPDFTASVATGTAWRCFWHRRWALGIAAGQSQSPQPTTAAPKPLSAAKMNASTGRCAVVNRVCRTFPHSSPLFSETPFLCPLLLRSSR